MITDAQCADLCAAIYRGAYGPDHVFSVYDGGEDDGICWAVDHTEDGDVVVFRGSDNFPDWFRNLVALANPFSHHEFGPVHPGFLLGMEHAWDDIKKVLTQLTPPVVTGHSLGAAHADILCGLMIIDGLVPARRVCFGEPKPGFAPLAAVLEHVPSASYRTRGMLDEHGMSHDLVTDVPFSFPPEEYVHPAPLTDLAAVAPPSDWGAFRYHHMEVYQAALKRGV